jgi:hypothetical protein
MEFVKQQHERGCCVACAAMLTGRSYEDVWKDQLKAFGTPEEVLQLRFIDWRVYLSCMGFETGMYEVEGPLFEAIQTLPKAIRFFCSIGTVENHPKNSPQNTHAIIVDENGLVFDPATDAPGTYPIEHYQASPKKVLLAVSVHDRRAI